MTTYQQRVQQVTDYIGKHLDEELSLAQLSAEACLSKFHFHRIFTAFTGLSLQQYIRWLRLKRAAHQLIIEQDRSILDIAINAGFESHEAFSRAFKKQCGMSPSEFRCEQSWQLWSKAPYCLPEQGESTMNIEMREINEIRLAMIEHRGDPKYVAQSVNTLIAWAKAQPMNLKPKSGDSFAFGYDDPRVVTPDEFRMDLGVRIPESLTIDSDVIVEKRIPAGRYAVALHKGSREQLGDTVYPMYREWLPQSGEELGDLPCVFSYLNFEHDVAETELLTEVWLLLK